MIVGMCFRRLRFGGMWARDMQICRCAKANRAILPQEKVNGSLPHGMSCNGIGRRIIEQTETGRRLSPLLGERVRVREVVSPKSRQAPATALLSRRIPQCGRRRTTCSNNPRSRPDAARSRHRLCRVLAETELIGVYRDCLIPAPMPYIGVIPHVPACPVLLFTGLMMCSSRVSQSS
jgi:hypothetical protein